MNALALVIAAAAVGVDYGWQPNARGDLEYIIQLHPANLDALREGSEISSVLDPQIRGVRAFRIRVGTEDVPRDGAAPVAAAEPAGPEPAGPEPAGTSEIAERPAGGELASVGSELPPLSSPARLRFDAQFPETPGIAQDSAAPPRPWQLPQQPSLDYPALSHPAPGAPDNRAPGSFPPSPYVPAGQGTQAELPSGSLVHRPAGYDEPQLPNGGSQVPSDNDVVPTNPAGDDPAEAPVESETVPAGGGEPWLPLTLTALALFASVGLNVYLGWIAWGIYSRYRALLEDIRAAAPSGS